jgi:hypothetical protein
MYLQDDPFLSVLGVFSIFVVGFAGVMIVLFAVWFAAQKCIHLILARLLTSGNRNTGADEDR